MARSRTPFSGIVISLRGNISGRDHRQENQPPFVQAALKAGWHVCVDVFFWNGVFFLPHAPLNGRTSSPMPPAFFSNQRVWSRATDAVALDALCSINAHCFMDSADPTLTSAQFIWTPHPHGLTDRSVAYIPANYNSQQKAVDIPPWLELGEPAGLCSNEPSSYI